MLVKELLLKCQLSDHVEILLASYCESNWDIPVSRGKAVKTNPLGESRVIKPPTSIGYY